MLTNTPRADVTEFRRHFEEQDGGQTDASRGDRLTSAAHADATRRSHQRTRAAHKLCNDRGVDPGPVLLLVAIVHLIKKKQIVAHVCVRPLTNIS